MKEVGKATIVSGCPRSGTSLMMLCMSMALGEDKIIGAKFPRRRGIMVGDQRENETDDEYSARAYLFEKMNPPHVIEKKLEDFEAARDMNPNGFWECRYTMARGLHWHYGIPDLTGKVIKTVSQGLVNSDPHMIEHVVFMVRHPRNVAKSHEKLRRMPFISAKEEQEIKIHTPQMFIDVTYRAALWFIENPDVPVMFVNYDDLVSNPDAVLTGVQDFIGAGDFSEHPVDPKLRRSYPEDIENHLWEYAEEIYDLLLVKDYEGIVKYYRDNIKEIKKEEVATPCVRIKQRVGYNDCVDCRSCSGDKAINFIKNKIKQADASNINWRKEPCMFECLTDPFSDHISVDESIEKNHWLEFEIQPELALEV